MWGTTSHTDTQVLSHHIAGPSFTTFGYGSCIGNINYLLRTSSVDWLSNSSAQKKFPTSRASPPRNSRGSLRLTAV